MVLKETTMYTLCNNFINDRSAGLKFEYNVGACKGHLWFQCPAPLNVEVSVIFVCF